jgi:hypothetical protein
MRFTQSKFYVFDDLNNLTGLTVADSQINDVKFLTPLTNLRMLRLNNNDISNIKPLESLVNLERLDLNNNQISDIKSLANLTNLHWLYLENNPVKDIEPLANLTKLTRLNLSKTLTTTSRVMWLKKRLPHCEIRYAFVKNNIHYVKRNNEWYIHTEE